MASFSLPIKPQGFWQRRFIRVRRPNRMNRNGSTVAFAGPAPPATARDARPTGGSSTAAVLVVVRGRTFPTTYSLGVGGGDSIGSWQMALWQSVARGLGLRTDVLFT